MLRPPTKATFGLKGPAGDVYGSVLNQPLSMQPNLPCKFKAKTKPATSVVRLSPAYPCNFGWTALVLAGEMILNNIPVLA